MIYTIKETILKNGKKIYAPLAKEENKLFLGLYSSRWQRILKIYNRYTLLDIFDEDEDFDLTASDCVEHINAYIDYLEKMEGHKTRLIKYHDKSEFEQEKESKLEKVNMHLGFSSIESWMPKKIIDLKKLL